MTQKLKLRSMSSDWAPESFEAFVKLWRSGVSIAEIAQQYGTTPGAVRVRASYLRSKGHHLDRRRCSPKKNGSTCEVILNMLGTGNTHAEIAKALGLTRQWVSVVAMQARDVGDPRGYINPRFWPDEMREAYRLYRRKQFSATEARAAVGQILQI